MSGFVRFDFDGRLEEKDGQQFVSGRGMYGDGYTRIHRPEPHGFISSPPKGSKGLLLPSPNNPDFAVVLGLEHPARRPADIPGGGSALYDAAGNIIKVVMGDGIVIDVAGSAYLVRKGGVTFRISGAGVDVTGGYIRHNGKDIGDTHRHTGVVPGSGSTGVPV
ncbi:phage baseplate assembly protein [Agrobacterium deltaense]